MIEFAIVYAGIGGLLALVWLKYGARKLPIFLLWSAGWPILVFALFYTLFFSNLDDV